MMLLFKDPMFFHQDKPSLLAGWLGRGLRVSKNDFDQVAEAWDNPDWIDIALSFYSYRWKNAPGESRYDHLESLQLTQPQIIVPSILLLGEQKYFDASYQRIVVSGVGHFIQHEKPQAVIDSLFSH